MNPYIGELPNPFTNGNIIGDNIKPDEYHRENAERGSKDLVMGRSSLLEVLNNPHRWLMGYKSKNTDATEWGSIMDCKVMSPQQFKERYAITPATYPDKDGMQKKWTFAANYCKQWKEDHAGQEIVGAETNTQTDNALKFLYGDPEAREFIKVSKKQVMVMATYLDKETGISVPVKTLMDLLPDVEHPRFGKDMADFKTCANGHPFPWTRAVNSYGYATQAAFYLDVYAAAVPMERDTFRHILQESEPPWEVGKRILSQEFVEIGRMKYMAALELYCQCLATNSWPGYEMEKPGRMIIDGWLLTVPEPWMSND